MNKPIRIWYQSFVDEPNGRVYWQRLRKHLAAIVEPGTSVDVHGISPHDNYAHALVEFRCARQAIVNAIRAEREGYDAVVIGHMQDSGLYEARAAVDIPVVSLGEASMLHACQLGQRIGIVTINPRFIPWFHHQIRKYGFEHRVAGVHAIASDPNRMLAAFDDPAAAEASQREFDAQAKRLVENGVDVLIPGGGLAMTLFSDIHGHTVAGAPVVNGIAVVVKTAELHVKLKRLTGLGPSRAGGFAKPPPQIIEEFLAHPKGV